MNTKPIRKINWNFTFGTALLIVNAGVGVADFLQDGIAWPCLVTACILQVAVLVISRMNGTMERAGKV